MPRWSPHNVVTFLSHAPTTRTVNRFFPQSSTGRLSPGLLQQHTFQELPSAMLGRQRLGFRQDDKMFELQW
jgi:hypothetical protein